MDWGAVARAAALCVVMAGTEAVLGGSDLAQWLNSLRRPRVYAPLWVWILVAIVTYLLQGIIAYRLLATGPTGPAIAAFAALVSHGRQRRL
jgi:tryptophan-rich sensory protein